QSQRTERFIARQGLPQARVIEHYRHALLDAAELLPNAARLPDGSLLCDPEALATLARVQPAPARVLLFAFEEAGLVQRGADCTLEATLLLNQSTAVILASLSSATERHLASALFEAIGAAQDRQATYRAADFHAATGLDPRAVDPLLVRLAEHDLL